MKRVIVRYGGEVFSTAGRELAEVEEEILQAVASGKPQWMSFNSGDGRYAEARVLISPGIPISLSAVLVDGQQGSEPGSDVDGFEWHEVSPSDIQSNQKAGRFSTR